MDKLVSQIIDEAFKSRAQQGLFFAKAKKSKKWAKMADEFADKTNWDKKLPYKVKKKKTKSEKEVDEIVDAEGNISHSDEPGNLNGYIRSKKTSDEVASATMGQMGTFGILGGPTNSSKTLKYWAEADMSHALGADETIADPKTNYDDAVETFASELEVPEDEAKERAKQMGYDPQLPDGKMRLIENPLNYINEYLAKKGKNSELVKKNHNESEKKPITPVIKRQLQSMKKTLKNNNLSIQDITEYLEDNE